MYWSNGSQILAPHDKHIAALIERHQQPWPLDVATLTDRLGNALLHDPTRDVSDAYYARIAAEWCFARAANERSALRLTFTAMHGVGAKWVLRAFQAYGLPPYFPVMQQLFPDPAFPTVAFPNPEEGQGALCLAFEGEWLPRFLCVLTMASAAADRIDSPVVIACDPDADRLAAAEKTPRLSRGLASLRCSLHRCSGWKPLSGNEIGTLLCDWLLGQYRARHPDVAPSRLLLVNTTVSSKMLQRIAQVEGCRYEECLTGFKCVLVALFVLLTQIQGRGESHYCCPRSRTPQWIGDVVLRLEVHVSAGVCSAH